MIRTEGQHRREAEFDRWETLRRMTPEESIVVGEALLTSEIMRVAAFSDDDHPRSLASALGIGDAAEDASLWSRLQGVLAKARALGAG